MLEATIALSLPVLVALPHILPLQTVAPQTAAAVWFLALALRALVAMGTALFVLVYLPQTGAFRAVAGWCWDVVTHHLGLSGHPLAHTAAVLPALLIAGSLLWLAFGLTRAVIALRLMLARRRIGDGPMGSVVIVNEGIVVALTRLGRARIVVSKRALEAMDSDELEASFAHELGHLRRRHRPLFFIGSALAAAGRLLPGSAAAERQLTFSLERDADQYAVRATRDPLSLASAICKASLSGSKSSAIAALAGRGRVALRLDYLLGEGRAGAALERSSRALAVFMATVTLALLVTLPAWAVASPARLASSDAAASDCV